MPEHDDNAINGLVVRQRLSLSERLRDSKTIFVCLGAIFAFSFCVGLYASIFGIPVAFSSFGFFGCFTFGLLIGLAAVFALSGTNKMLSKKKRALLELQKKMLREPSEDLCRDLDTLVKGYLKQKNYAVADFYSNKLLQQSALAPSERANRLRDVMLSIGAWVSTPKYHKKPNYYLVWLFESRGMLTMTSSRLQYTSKRISFDIDLADVREISVRHHSRWLKPIPFRYLAIKFVDDGMEQCLYVTPSHSQAETIFETNAAVEEWHQYILVARDQRIGSRAIERMKAQVPGVESSSEQSVKP